MVASFVAEMGVAKGGNVLAGVGILEFVSRASYV